MDKNKKHIEAKEFFKLLDQEQLNVSHELDEFDMEAMEGLKMVKDPEAAHAKVNAAVDQKLEELIAAEKKGKPKTGLYILSLAASLVLLFGLFFIFHNADTNEANVAVTKSAEEKSVSPATEMAPLEKQISEVNSDASVVEDREEPLSSGKVAKPIITGTKDEIADKSGFKAAEIDQVNAEPPAQKELLEDVVSTGNYKKEEQKLDNVVDSKFTATSNGGLVTPKVADEETIVLSEKSKRAVTKKKESKGDAKKSVAASDDYAAGAPPVEQETIALSENKNVPVTSSTPATVNSTTSTTTLNANSTIATGNVYGTLAQNYKNNEVDVQAEFKGGKVAFDKYVTNNLKIPASSPAEEVIVVKFSVDKEGKVSKPKIESKTGNCADCEKEAIRFVKAMPAWIPATKGGAAVSSHRTIVLSFKK